MNKTLTLFRDPLNIEQRKEIINFKNKNPRTSIRGLAIIMSHKLNRFVSKSAVDRALGSKDRIMKTSTFTQRNQQRTRVTKHNFKEDFDQIFKTDVS
jgi:hypothetical protein